MSAIQIEAIEAAGGIALLGGYELNRNPFLQASLGWHAWRRGWWSAWEALPDEPDI